MFTKFGVGRLNGDRDQRGRLYKGGKILQTAKYSPKQIIPCNIQTMVTAIQVLCLTAIHGSRCTASFS